MKRATMIALLCASAFAPSMPGTARVAQSQVPPVPAAPIRYMRGWPLDRDGMVKMFLHSGRIRVIGWDRDSISVTGTVSRGVVPYGGGSRRAVKFGIEGNTPDSWGDLTVRVPAGAVAPPRPPVDPLLPPRPPPGVVPIGVVVPGVDGFVPVGDPDGVVVVGEVVVGDVVEAAVVSSVDDDVVESSAVPPSSVVVVPSVPVFSDACPSSVPAVVCPSVPAVSPVVPPDCVPWSLPPPPGIDGSPPSPPTTFGAVGMNGTPVSDCTATWLYTVRRMRRASCSASSPSN